MTVTSPLGVAEAAGDTPGGPTRQVGNVSHPLRRLLHKPLGVAALVVVVGIAVACAAASLIAPYGPQASSFSATLQGPSGAHLLGTDELGRDILSRLLYGGQPTLLAAAEATVIAIVVGTILGVVGGYRRGKIDRALSLWGDLLLAMPVLVVLIVVISVFPASLYPTMIPLGLLLSAAPMRVVRSVTFSVREDLYIDAARVSGLSHRRIMTRHVLPRIAGTIVVQATLVAAVAVILTSGLAFLGFGIHVPAPSWGTMVADAASEYQTNAWYLVPTGGVITLTVLALGLLGDAVRDVVAEQWTGSGAARPPKRRQPSQAAVEEPNVPDPTGRRVLSVRRLSVAFGDPAGAPLTVVDEVSFDLVAGRTLAIVGESGCGKSMTARALLGVVPPGGRITGRVRLGDQELVGQSASVLSGVRGRRIGFIGQEPISSLDPTQTIGAALREVVRRYDGSGTRDADARVLELLTQVRLRDPERVARLRPHQISGGMAQRVTIARALAGRPEVLVADEPTTALDVTVQADIVALLRSLQISTDIAVLLITHDWGVVAALADDVMVMYAGQGVEWAEAAPMFDAPLHPYTDALLRSDPHRGNPGTALTVIGGTVPAPGSWPTGCRFAPRCRFATPECAEAPVPMIPAGAARLSRCIHIDELRVAT